MWWFKKRILGFKINRSAKLSRQVATVTYQNSKNVAVIGDGRTEGGKDKRMQDLIHLFRRDGKEVTVLCLKDRPKSKETLGKDEFSTADISLFGEVSGASLISFQNKKYDFLINLSEEPDEAIGFIFTLTNASCKITPPSELLMASADLILITKNKDSIENTIYHYIKEIK
ncbi:MAG: hypothetical protein LAT68_09775 [Cyclobacteriaceae bacterium]|nr:hypothetical protein [Cyclobacteriaceae bacterium]MCH8516604.1 hypothetical protein [Cyclobacteriaceae bacterium]